MNKEILNCISHLRSYEGSAVGDDYKDYCGIYYDDVYKIVTKNKLCTSVGRDLLWSINHDNLNNFLSRYEYI